MTLDYRTDRVRVIVNNKGVVTRVPSIGWLTITKIWLRIKIN